MTLTARLRLIEARSRALLGAQDKRIEKVVRICSCFPEFTPPRAAIIRGQVRAWLAANPDATDMDLAMCPPARELAHAILVEKSDEPLQGNPRARPAAAPGVMVCVQATHARGSGFTQQCPPWRLSVASVPSR